MKNKTISLLLFVALCLYFRSGWSAPADAVVIYSAISSGDTVAIEGRVIESEKGSAPNSTDSKRANLRRNVGLMINKERRHYPVTVRVGIHEWNTTTDQEGYFRVAVDGLKELLPAWHDVTALTAHGEGLARLLIPPSANTHGLISDIDDTIQVTEVNSKRRMLANTFFLNAMQREAVPGVVAFYRQLAQANVQPDLTPIIYLSASPRQLHTSIAAFLVYNEFPRGVLITKRVTDDSTSEPISNQVAYKTVKIENILAQLPHVRFTLIGDDGERDPEIYADIQKRFPDRVAAIWIRQVNPDPKRARLVGQGVLNEALAAYLPATKTDH